MAHENVAEDCVLASRDEIVYSSANIDRAARGAKDRTSLLMNAIHELRRNFHRLRSALRI